MISSILNPGVFEPDFRPFIGLIIMLLLCFGGVLIKYWDLFKKDLDSNWEQ
ncbi:MAG: hypothetical protein O3A39_04795 [Proteobacteria bacterium]|nr:hypothetical protein [Pseudomonadota bacterium]